jgi:predicted aspartyl protease
VSLFIAGKVDRFPWIELEVESANGTRRIDFVVDTGFDGELAVPHAFRSFLGTPVSTCTVFFANGYRERRGIVECSIRGGDLDRTVEVMYIDGENALAGMDLFRGCRITIDAEDGGDVTVDDA